MQSKPRFTVEVTAPGKVILFGEHSVVYEKECIAGSIGLKTTGLLQRFNSSANFENFLIVKSNEFESDLVVNREHIIRCLNLNDKSDIGSVLQTTSNAHPSNLSNTMLVILFKMICHLSSTKSISLEDCCSYCLCLRSEVPLGSGLGSSASISVVLSTCLLLMLTLNNRWLTATKMMELIDLDEINELAYVAETHIHGKASGIDNTISVFGGVIAYKRARIEQIKMKEKIKVLICQTNVKRETKEIVNKVSNLKTKHPQIIGKVLDAIDEISKEAKTVFIADENVINKLNGLAKINQDMLSALGTSHEKIDEIIKITKKYNINSKITGAGGGGCTIAFIDEKSLNEEMLKELENIGANPKVVELGTKGLEIKTIQNE